MSQLPRVVVVGGGFAGLHAVRALRSAPVRVTLVDRRNFHLFQPLLYQVATGGLSPGNIAAPLRAVFRKQSNCEVVLADVEGFDLTRKRLVLADGELEYDTLLVCAGARTSYFGKDQWAEDAPGLKSIEDAIEIRRRVLTAFEAAERETDPTRRKAWLTFVVVGGGPTGVELAGTLAEIARYTLDREYRNINPSDSRIIVVDASDRILSSFDERLAAYATGRLSKLGVEVRSHSRVEEVRPGGATISDKDKHREEIACETVLWGAGVIASPLGAKLAEGAGITLARGGRVPVGPNLTLEGHPNVFVLGDLAYLEQEGKPLPQVAPVAIQQGQYVARVLAERTRGAASKPFRYKDLGSMATIGRSAAIVEIGRWKWTGRFAWIVWLFVHLIQLVRFESRVLVMMQWAWNYFTYSRSTRLITGRTLDLDEVGHTRKL
jgi:NADH:ubiquinone reductase (H+-translocating)